MPQTKRKLKTNKAKLTAADMVRWIDDFEERAQEAEYTELGEVWSLLRSLRFHLKTL